MTCPAFFMRVRREVAWNILDEFTAARPQACGKKNGGEIRSATPERDNRLRGVNSEEPWNDGNRTVSERAAQKRKITWKSFLNVRFTL